MLSTTKLKIIEDFVSSSDREELIWLNGYLQGILANDKPCEQDLPAQPSVNKLTISYGTETGNSKKLASEFAAKAKKIGIATKLVSLDQYRLNDLQKETHFLTILSTHGDGDPPAAAKKFYDHIHNNGFKLHDLRYSVLALGDSSYPLFCKAGEDVDRQLNQLGGQRISSLKKCDIDFDDEAEAWFSQVLKQLRSGNEAVQPIAPAPNRSSGKKTYEGIILANINLNDRGSEKETHHIEIAAAGLDYLPGDCLGIIPKNPGPIVEEILSLTGIDRKKKYSFRDEELSAYDLLENKLNIVCLPERVVQKYAKLVGQSIPETRIGLLDLLKIYPLGKAWELNSLIDLLEPIAPRLYSISSSPDAHNGEVHITVARDRFQVNSKWNYGLCSGYLAQFETDESIDFYIHRNLQFRLPPDDKDIIMIGPGTGIAPFRSFLAQREANGSSGRSWLFFGDQHFVTDFLYQSEIQNWLSMGVLSKVDLAFSRDQERKIYVQHKMQNQSRQLYEWIDQGAFIYLCGNKDPMSLDVEHVLANIIRDEGRKTGEEATEFLRQLKEEGRFVKDVY